MRRYQQHPAWQRAHRLNVWLYRLTRRLPEVEQRGLAAELRRSVKEIPVAIAAGLHADTVEAQLELLSLARQSARRADAQLELVSALAYLHPFIVGKMRREARAIAETIAALERQMRRPRRQTADL